MLLSLQIPGQYKQAFRFKAVLIVLCLAITAHSQKTTNRQSAIKKYLAEIRKADKDSIPFYFLSRYSPVFADQDSITLFVKDACKSFNLLEFSKKAYTRGTGLLQKTEAEPQTAPFLTVHGSVQYDFLYRSYVDTPFSQHDFQQHTVQAFLTIVVKDKYPLRVNLSNRMGNSPYFRDLFTMNTQFDRYAYLNKAKQEVIDRINRTQFDKPELKMVEAALQTEIKKLDALRGWLNDKDLLQRIIEEREKLYYKAKKASMPAVVQKQPWEITDSLKIPRYTKWDIDSVKNIAKEMPVDDDFIKKVEAKRKELDSLQKKITVMQAKKDSMQNALSKNIVSIKQKLYKATSAKDVSRVKKENGIGEEKTSKLESFLSGVKSIGIGRSMVNYSELTAWNVSLTGLNIEYNPGIYAALAAGKIDYGFRDFFGKSLRQKEQHLLMGRFGFGDREKKAIIFSAFTGRKNNYENAFRDTVPDHVNVVGYSIETIFRKNEHSFFSAELAKTTKPLTGSFRNNNGLKNLVNFSDNANLGISIKGETMVPETDTKLSGFFRKTGESFQSFSLFTYNTDQTAWLLKLDQPFLKNKIGVTAMLRRNDFINPFAQQTFKTSTVFKTIQVNVRIPKWPVLSAGYYPGSQLYVVDREKIHENAYYILNGTLVHSYAAGGTRMISSLIYNRYSSKGTDSGFISYKGINYVASQTFIVGKAQLQGQYIYTDQEQMQFYTLEANADYSFSSIFQLGVGGKYNKVAGGEIYLGGQASIRSELKKLGTFQLQYEKSYLPTIQQTLFPMEMGRLSWFKTF